MLFSLKQEAPASIGGSTFTKQSLREFVQANGAGSASERYFHDFVKQIPEAIRFSDLKYSAVNSFFG